MLPAEETLVPTILALLFIGDGYRAHAAEKQRSGKTTFPVTSEWISNLTKSGYDRCRTPTYDKGRPTHVKIGVYVESMGNFQATSMDYDVDIYFKEWWQDERLAHKNLNLPGFNDEGLINKIWRPDVYFANSKVAKTNLLTMPNTHMRIAENGSIFYSIRVNLKLSCAMDFRNYPLDQQICTIRIISYGYTVDEVNVTWDDPRTAVKVNANNEPSELSFTDVQTVECDGRYPTGVYSCLEGQFFLDRQLTFYLVQNYIPTGLIVAVSWISFWIDPSSVPGRVTLAVSTLLTIATQSAAIMQKLPPVTYTKAIDIWLGTCLLFVFGALLEYACINSLRTMENATSSKAASDPSTKKAAAAPALANRKTGVEQLANGSANSARAPMAEPEDVLSARKDAPDETVEFVKTDEPIVRTSNGNLKAHQLERVCRVAFPIAFITFNVFYWLKYWYFGRQYLKDRS